MRLTVVGSKIGLRPEASGSSKVGGCDEVGVGADAEDKLAVCKAIADVVEGVGNTPAEAGVN